MVKPSADYALLMGSPIQHIALKLEGAAPAALSISELCDGFRGSLPSDLHRIKLHEGAKTRHEAIEWQIRYAVELLGDQLRVDGDLVSFAPGMSLDDLRWGERQDKVYRPVDEHARLRDPFSRVTGEFADNVRLELGPLDELRDSMKSFGWLEYFPAIQDERGSVLVGHRRLKVAKELGIEPRIITVRFGMGDYADAQRFKLAIASNLGGRGLTPNDRKRLAQYLYGEKEWSQQRIAEALNVDQKTVSRDLRELGTMPNSKRGKPRIAMEPAEPKKKGRPSKILTPEQDSAIGKLFDEGKSREEIAKETGIGEHTLQLARQRHVGRQSVLNEMKQCACPNCGVLHAYSPVRE